jgi:hypothetical protein
MIDSLIHVDMYLRFGLKKGQVPNGLRYRRLGEPTHETEPSSSLEPGSKRGAHQPSGARFVGRLWAAAGGPVDLNRDPARSGSRVDQVKRDIRAGGSK